MKKQFLRIGERKVLRSAFNLSFEKKFTCDMGELIPICCELALPGDVWKIGVEDLVRMQPILAPIMHPIQVKTEFFAVPLRLIMGSLDEDDWEAFITGDVDGLDATTLDTWTPTETTIGTLWDYFGFPTGGTPGVPIVPSGVAPLAFPLYAYNKIYNEWYRDETLQTERVYNDETLAYRNWGKDYFTAALPNQQRGTAPALPITGTTNANFLSSTSISDTFSANGLGLEADAVAVADNLIRIAVTAGNTTWSDNVKNALSDNVVDFSAASTFNVSDLRLATQIQRFQELNARAGVRLVEFLKAQFGTSPKDMRLQRSEYIGGSKQNIIVSEVLQTSEDGVTPQGNMAGHGISGGNSFIGKYRCEEHMIIIGLLSIMPVAVYQQGINKQWLYETRYEWPTPIFANLSEQAILTAELYVTDGNQSANEAIFGYIGRYDELRVKHSMICGDMRETFDYWHISRKFTSAPTLNSAFITCNPRKDIFAAPSEDGFIVNHANIIKAVRPIPSMSNPGLMDH